jgi:predicted aconitase
LLLFISGYLTIFGGALVPISLAQINGATYFAVNEKELSLEGLARQRKVKLLL